MTLRQDIQRLRTRLEPPDAPPPEVHGRLMHALLDGVFRRALVWAVESPWPNDNVRSRCSVRVVELLDAAGILPAGWRSMVSAGDWRTAEQPITLAIHAGRLDGRRDLCALLDELEVAWPGDFLLGWAVRDQGHATWERALVDRLRDRYGLAALTLHYDVDCLSCLLRLNPAAPDERVLRKELADLLDALTVDTYLAMPDIEVLTRLRTILGGTCSDRAYGLWTGRERQLVESITAPAPAKALS